jgi:hypothetical protein
MSLPVPNFDYDDNNSDVLDPRSIDQLTDPERYTKLTFDNMMDLTDIKKNNPPHVRVFRLISATNRIFKQRIVYQGENGKQVFTWDDEDLNIKDDAKGTGRTRAHIDKMTGRSGFYIRKSQMPSAAVDVASEDVVEAPNNATEAVSPPPKKKGMFGRMFSRGKDVPTAATESADPPPKKKGMFGRMFNRSKGGSVRSTKRRRKTKRRKTKRRKTKRRKTKRRKTKRRKTRRKR